VQLDTGLHGWYDPLKSLMDKVKWLLVVTGLVWVVSFLEFLDGNIRWVQLNTGLTCVVSSLELYYG
jgi:hypothetical protein